MATSLSSGGQGDSLNRTRAVARNAADTFSAIRVIAARICACNGAVSVRKVPSSRAVSGMMLVVVPASIRPTVTTAVSHGLISRLMIACNAVVRCAATTTGSMLAPGFAP